MDDTPNLLLPFILAAQSQKHVTHNEALRKLDALVQLAVLDRGLATPPGSPANGARYIVAASPSGAWAGHAGKIAAYQDGAWAFYAPSEGWLSWVADEDVVVIWNGTVWTALSGGGGVADHGALTGLADDDHTQYLNNARGDVRYDALGAADTVSGALSAHVAAGDPHPQYVTAAEGNAAYTPIAPATLGVNATADATNKLAVNSPAILLNHAGAGHQVKINKNAAGDTASVLYQTAFSGRAEFGTTGDDNFHVKVSADGTSFQEAIVINRTTGAVDMPLTGPDIQIYTAAGAFNWTKPSWAHANSMVEVHLLGGGGGGGSGRRGAAATVRCGGGGGGSGAYTKINMRASDLTAVVAGSVGAGGTGGAAQATNSTNGNNGVAGGNSTFGVYRAFGGNFGSGGSATAGAAGAAFGVVTPFSLAAGAGGAASTTGLVGTAAGNQSTSIPTGGGGGGGVSSANAVAGGGAGGTNTTIHSTSVATGGTAGTAGGNGGAGNPATYAFGVALGSGGGGGASSITVAAGNGGLGGAGAGGGGGAASLDGFNSGAGANGGNGWVVVVTDR